jgi:Heterokaryon incompatibility protein (HET)
VRIVSPRNSHLELLQLWCSDRQSEMKGRRHHKVALCSEFYTVAIYHNIWPFVWAGQQNHSISVVLAYRNMNIPIRNTIDIHVCSSTSCNPASIGWQVTQAQPASLADIKNLNHAVTSFGSQTTTDAYANSILTDNSSIRLMKLLPARDYSSMLRCSLIVASLKRVPPYEALSYVWESENRGSGILCGSALLGVTVNCEAAIRRLRRGDEPRLLWIDSICIYASRCRVTCRRFWWWMTPFLGVFNTTFSSDSEYLSSLPTHVLGPNLSQLSYYSSIKGWTPPSKH